MWEYEKLGMVKYWILNEKSALLEFKYVFVSLFPVGLRDPNVIIALVPVIFRDLGIDDHLFRMPTCHILCADSSLKLLLTQDSTRSFLLLCCSVCAGAENENTGKSIISTLLNLSDKVAWGSCYLSKGGYLPLSGHCMVILKIVRNPVSFFVLSFLWDMKEHDGESSFWATLNPKEWDQTFFQARVQG